jgi:hypothetical protein
MRVCPECKKEFVPNRDWQEFCCKQHQQAFNRRRYREERVRIELGLPEPVEVVPPVDLGDLAGMI